jgi:tellurite resistance protein TerC
MSGDTLHWVGFIIFVIVALFIDLGLSKKKNATLNHKSALKQSIFWVGLGVAFGAWIYHDLGAAQGEAWFTGYLLEKALSVDNLFVFILVFSYFKVTPAQQQRVLLWGILGAIVLRGIFIAGGTILIEQFHWILYVMGVFLIYSGFKLAFMNEEEEEGDLSDNKIVTTIQKYLPMTSEFVGDKFMVKVPETGAIRFTPLFMVLLVIEFSDVVFAVDSVPAIFGVTTDPYIVYTSNIFAILGLRALFFLLQDALSKIHYLNTALSFVLCFIGFKMLVEPWYHFSTSHSLGIVFGALGLATFLSYQKNRREAKSLPSSESND